MKKIMYVLIVVFVGLFLAGCASKKPAEKDPNKIQVVTTIFAAYDFIRQVGGDKVEAVLLLPPGTESHNYEPTPRDINKIKQAKVFIYVGGESDAWVTRTLEAIKTKDTKIIKLMDLVPTVKESFVEGMEKPKDEHEHEDEDEEDEYDEHVWTSPKNAIQIVNKISETLGEIDTVNKEVYESNGKKYTEKLTQLDEKFMEIVKTAKRKELIFGDRFPLRYFVDAYGLDYYAAFPGCAKDTEPSASTIAFLIDKVKRDKIPVVFHIELSNEKIAETICQATGAKKREFNTCHNIKKEELKKGVTYLSLMENNVKVLKEALN